MTKINSMNSKNPINTMNSIKLNLNKVSKTYSEKEYIFRDISSDLQNGEILAIAGENGSGKTTLLKIIAGTLKQTSGTISLNIDNVNIIRENIYEHIGYVSPYLNLYDEFTPIEHLKIFADIRRITFDRQKAEYWLKKFNLYRKMNEHIRTFSSGMKQRMKYILALQNEPELLLLDEPSSNLDADGVSTVLSIIFEHQKSGGGVIIATNENHEKALAGNVIQLSKN
jgi:heme exporter protein A